MEDNAEIFFVGNKPEGSKFGMDYELASFPLQQGSICKKELESWCSVVDNHGFFSDDCFTLEIDDNNASLNHLRKAELTYYNLVSCCVNVYYCESNIDMMMNILLRNNDKTGDFFVWPASLMHNMVLKFQKGLGFEKEKVKIYSKKIPTGTLLQT